MKIDLAIVSSSEFRKNDVMRNYGWHCDGEW